MSRTFYHNMTTGKLNETDDLDFIEAYSENDECYYTVAGDATLTPVTSQMIESLRDRYSEELNDY